MSNVENGRPCPDCSALNAKTATSCWLCYRPFIDEPPLPPSRLPPEAASWIVPNREALPAYDVVAGLIASQVALGLTISVLMQSQILGILLLFILIPLGLAALTHVFRIRRRGGRLGYLEIFLGAFGGAAAIGLLGLAILIAGLEVCVSVFAPSGFH